jgi:hypothetical protein
MRRIEVAAVLAMVLIAPSSFGMQAAAPATSPAPVSAPSLSKDQEKSLDKAARKVFKRCTGDAGKHPSDVAEACAQLASPLYNQLHDKAAAHQALQYSCALGDSMGCNELGSDLAESGDLAGARAAWTAPPCAYNGRCKEHLFESYANEKPPNLAQAEAIGLPLCEKDGEERVCQRLQELGSKVDFAKIAERHKEARIAEIKTQIGKNENAIAFSTGALGLAQSALNSASGLLQVLYCKSQVAMYESSIKSAQSENQNLTAELVKLQGSSEGVPTGAGFGSALAGLAMQGVAHANDVQVAGGTLNAGSFVPASVSQSAADTAGGSSLSPTAGTGGSDGGLYTGVDAELVHKVLAKSGPSSCAPVKPPQHPNTWVCARDSMIYQAQELAWGAECQAETGHPDDAVKLAKVLEETLKNAGDLCRGQGMATQCSTERIMSCAELPHH